MNMTKISRGEIVKTKNGLKALKVYDHPEALVIHLILEPGSRLDTHTTPVDVFFYVVHGTVWIEIGDEREAVSKDTIVESPRNIPHALENKDNHETAQILVVKTPRP